MAALLLASIVMPACHKDASNDIKIICDAPLNCNRCADVLPEDRMQVMSEYILDTIEGSEARELYESFGQRPPAERVEVLRQKATEAGLEVCPLADMWAEELP